MKKTGLLLFNFSVVLSLFSQHKTKEEIFYMLDANFKGTTQRSATYFIHVQKITDTCWQFDTYKVLGPLISSEQYKDEKGKGPNGTFSYYYKNGFIDSTGDYSNGYQNGTWYYFNDTGKVTARKDFSMGHITQTASLSTTSSLREANIADSFTHVESPSFFGESINSWPKYLNNNFVYPDGAAKNKIQGNVTAIFSIEENSSISHLAIFKSAEYSLDNETLELIRKSADWHPAVRDGIKIKSTRKQTINFVLER
jgi:periplasmic protein TonB